MTGPCPGQTLVIPPVAIYGPCLTIRRFRVAAVPLYNSYQDVYSFVQRFSAALS